MRPRLSDKAYILGCIRYVKMQMSQAPQRVRLIEAVRYTLQSRDRAGEEGKILIYHADQLNTCDPYGSGGRMIALF